MARRTRTQTEKLARVRVQVRDVFARVLARDPGIRIVVEQDGSLDIHFRDRIYTLTVGASSSSIIVSVAKNEKNSFHDYGRRNTLDNTLQVNFFSFSCPISRMGRLRKTALILHKKMQHAEVFEVMNA